MSRTLAAALVFVLAGAAAAQDVEEILSAMDEASAQLRSFVARYRQEETDEFGDKTILQGSFYYLSDPGRYRWVSESGGRPLEEVVSNGTRAWMVRHAVRKVEVVTLTSVKRRTGGITLTGGSEELVACYHIALQGVEELVSGPAFHLLCTPKDGDSGADPLIESMELWIDVEQPAPVVKIRLEQRDGISTTLQFNQILRNEDIPASLFEFRVPGGYEEIHHE